MHRTIHLEYLKNSTSIRCNECKGALGEYRNDIPEASNLDKMILRRIYCIPPVFKLTDAELSKWK